jgi:hypothetical protein
MQQFGGLEINYFCVRLPASTVIHLNEQKFIKNNERIMYMTIASAKKFLYLKSDTEVRGMVAGR